MFEDDTLYSRTNDFIVDNNIPYSGGLASQVPYAVTFSECPLDLPITLSKNLIKILEDSDMRPSDYGPAYGGESVGLDLFYAGDYPVRIVGNQMSVEIDGIATQSWSKVLLGTGVRIALPNGYVAFIKDRGSISKTSFIRRAGVIDPGYTGEIFVNLIGNETIKPGDKLPVQLVVVKAETNYKVVSEEEFSVLTSDSKRKEGKIGSTN